MPEATYREAEEPHAVVAVPVASDWKQTYGATIMRVAQYLATALLGLLAGYLALPPQTVEVAVPALVTVEVQPVAAIPPVVSQTAPPAETTATYGPVRRLMAGVVRNRVSRELQRNGFASVGGDATPLTPEAAEKLTRKLTDGVIVSGIEVYGGPVGEDRPVLDLIKRVFDWVAEHPEFIKFLLSLLMLL